MTPENTKQYIDAWNAGYDAGSNFQSITTNPYINNIKTEQDKYLHTAWLDGFNAGRESTKN